MKKLMIILTFLFIKAPVYKLFGHANYKQSTTDTAKKNYDININSTPLTKGIDILVYDIFKDTLYVINKDKLVKINLKTGNISTNPNINLLLSKKIKANSYVKQIIVRENGFYLNCLDELDLIAYNAKIIKIYVRASFNYIAITDKGILMGSPSLIEYRSKTTGEILSKLSFDTSDNGFIRCLSGITCEADYSINVTEINVDQANKIKTNSYPPIGIFKNIKEPIVAYVDDRFFFAYAYSDRSNLYIIKKGDNKVFKQISFKGDKNCTPSPQFIAKEEGAPNFSATFYNGKYYIIALVNNRLKVLSFVI